VRRLSQLCRQRLFQPETRGRPAIQVLGMLESAGLEFDALWVMGMNDDLWPPPPRPSPLLPAELLRSAGSAHASAEVELDFAQRVHARLLAAPTVIFSWAQADGNRVLRPSPLIAGISCAAEVPGKVVTVAGQLAAEAPAALALLDDALAPPVAAGEKVSGGSWLLRAQAICPAWAYYQFRLGGEAMDEPVEGLDPAARGTLVHEALEALWTAVASSEALAALSGGARQEAIAEAVAKALQTFELDRRTILPARFRELEAARLAKLLDLWLAVEDKRGQAFEVIACEQPAEVEIEGIKVRMVVDRIDQLADGRQVIIDYKTGAAIDTKNWADQRITEPQLPIYAALVNDEVAAVVFRQGPARQAGLCRRRRRKGHPARRPGDRRRQAENFRSGGISRLDCRHYPLARASARRGQRGQGGPGRRRLRRRKGAAILRSPAPAPPARAAPPAGRGGLVACVSRPG
jgi:probable DNA repair protein